jgi:hypothetical protein
MKLAANMIRGLALLPPRLGNELPALRADSVNQSRFGRSGLNDGQNLGSEPPYQLLRQNRPDTLYQAAAEVSLDSCDCSRRNRLHRACLELQPVLFVPHPPALGHEPFPSGH